MAQVRWEDTDKVSLGYVPDFPEPLYQLVVLESGNVQPIVIKLALKMSLQPDLDAAKGYVQEWVNFTSSFAPLRQRNT